MDRNKNDSFYKTARDSVVVLIIACIAFAVCVSVLDVVAAKLWYAHATLYHAVAAIAAMSVIISLIGRHIIRGLDRARLEAEAAMRAKSELLSSVEHSANTFRVFYEAGHKLLSAISHDKIFNVISDTISHLISPCDRLAFILCDPAANRLRVEYVSGGGDDLRAGMEWEVGTSGIYMSAFNSKCVVNIPDIQAAKYYRFAPDEPPCPATHSLIVIPLFNGRECIGLFSAESAEPNRFGAEIKQALTTLIDNASVALARASLYGKLETLATTDLLTSLANRRMFEDTAAAEFERAKRYDRPLSLLMMDIDNFKAVNDTYGHSAGDAVLREMAACIRGAVRTSDLPARYGGEEFAVILPETDEAEAILLAERIRQAVEAREAACGDNRLRVTVSVGTVTYPAFGKSISDIIDFADYALYASKRGGKNRVTAYSKKIAAEMAFELR